MGKRRKTRERIVGGKSDANIAFGDARTLLKSLGFTEDIEGDHHIYRKEGVPIPINIQPDGGKVKPYQVKQMRKVLVDFGIE